MKIAVTSQNFKTVTNHAGKARKFIVYDVDANGTLSEITRQSLSQDYAFCNFDGPSHPIDGVDVLISQSFGMGFANKMAARGIKASLTDESDIQTAIANYLKHGQILPGAADAPTNDTAPATKKAAHNGCTCGGGCDCEGH